MTLHGTLKASKVRPLAKFNFIAGLPHSGLSVLMSLLAQNPKFSTGFNSAAETVLLKMNAWVENGGEISENLSDEQKTALRRTSMEAIYHDRPFGATVFDANRHWLDHVELLSRIYPLCRFIICVRNPAAVVNSIELSGPLTGDQEGLSKSVTRLIASDGLVGAEIARLRKALSSAQAERMFVLDYDRLSDNPEEVMDVLYDFLREPAFDHDYDNLGDCDGKFPWLSGAVARSGHPMVLPTRMILQLSGRAFWRNLRRTSATLMLGRSR